jgi:hypothetical protein
MPSGYEINRRIACLVLKNKTLPSRQVHNYVNSFLKPTDNQLLNSINSGMTKPPAPPTKAERRGTGNVNVSTEGNIEELKDRNKKRDDIVDKLKARRDDVLQRRKDKLDRLIKKGKERTDKEEKIRKRGVELMDDPAYNVKKTPAPTLDSFDFFKKLPSKKRGKLEPEGKEEEGGAEENKRVKRLGEENREIAERRKSFVAHSKVVYDMKQEKREKHTTLATREHLKQHFPDVTTTHLPVGRIPGTLKQEGRIINALDTYNKQKNNAIKTHQKDIHMIVDSRRPLDESIKQHKKSAKETYDAIIGAAHLRNAILREESSKILLDDARTGREVDKLLEGNLRGVDSEEEVKGRIDALIKRTKRNVKTHEETRARFGAEKEDKAKNLKGRGHGEFR